MPNLYIIYLLLLYQYRGIGISARRYVDGYNRNRVRRVVYSCILVSKRPSLRSKVHCAECTSRNLQSHVIIIYYTYKL